MRRRAALSRAATGAMNKRSTSVASGEQSAAVSGAMVAAVFAEPAWSANRIATRIACAFDGEPRRCAMRSRLRWCRCVHAQRFEFASARDAQWCSDAHAVHRAKPIQLRPNRSQWVGVCGPGAAATVPIVQLPPRPPAADEPLGAALEAVVDGVLVVATARGRRQFAATARAWELRRFEVVDAVTSATLPRSNNADGHLTIGERCVKASMRKALRAMLARNWSTSIVFESDVSGSGPALAARLRSAFGAQRRHAPSAGVVWLGRCYARGCYEDRRVGGDVFETRWSLCLHAFAVLSRNAAQRALGVLAPGACALAKCPADVAIATLVLASPMVGVAVWPAIFQQNRSLPSEVKYGALDRRSGVQKAGSNFVRHLYQTECADAELNLPEIKGFPRTQRRLLQQPMPPASTVAPEWAAVRNVDLDIWHNSEIGTDPRVVAAFVESTSVAERRERLLAAPASASLPLKRWWCRSVGAMRANVTGSRGYWKPHVARAIAAAAHARRGEWRDQVARRRALDDIDRRWGFAWIVGRRELIKRCVL